MKATFFVVMTVFMLLVSCTNAGTFNTPVTFTWTAPFDITIGSIKVPVTSYDLRLSTVEDSLANSWGQTMALDHLPTPANFGVSETFVDTLVLNIGTTYYFAIKSFDAYGNVSDISNIASVCVEDNVAPTIIFNFMGTVGDE